MIKANKIVVFGLALLALGCGCVASKTSKKGKKQSEEALRLAAICPPRMGEEEFCQIFTQEGGGGNRPIDILWVIDNSTSMCDNQTKLAQNFASFINKFAGQSQNVDFQMTLISAPQLSSGAVTYRNSNFGGRMYYIQYGTTLTSSGLKSGQQGFVDQFKNTVGQIGCRGHSYHAESGLVMVLDFLEENRQWMREDAFLLVIHVSDQYDDGTLIKSQSAVKLVRGSYCGNGYGGCEVTGERDHQKVATHYIDTLTSHKGSPFLFKIFSVVNKEPQAPRFNSVAKLSGGKAYDILKDSFDTILQDFGEEVAKISSAFQLKYPAEAGTVEVFIDGFPAPQGDWRYLEDQNAIRFEEGVFQDREGKSTIKVTYQTK